MSDSQKEIFTKIWNDYHFEMRRYCYTNFKGNSKEVEEIVETAFSLLWYKMTDDKVPPVPQAWLYKTINNLVKTEIRRQKKEQKYLNFNSELFVNLRYVVDMDEELANQELNIDLVKAIQEELNDEERELIKYIFFENKSHREIAVVLGISEDAVKQRRYRMMRKTRKILLQKKIKLGFIEK